MISIKRFILKIRLFFSTFFIKNRKERGFVYELEDIKKLPAKEQCKAVQKDWNKYMEEN